MWTELHVQQLYPHTTLSHFTHLLWLFILHHTSPYFTSLVQHYTPLFTHSSCIFCTTHWAPHTPLFGVYSHTLHISGWVTHTFSYTTPQIPFLWFIAQHLLFILAFFAHILCFTSFTPGILHLGVGYFTQFTSFSHSLSLWLMSFILHSLGGHVSLG